MYIHTQAPNGQIPHIYVYIGLRHLFSSVYLSYSLKVLIYFKLSLFSFFIWGAKRCLKRLSDIILFSNIPTPLRCWRWGVDLSRVARPSDWRLKVWNRFIGQGPHMRPFDRHVKQPITFSFILRYVSGLGNVATITDRCVKLSDVF